MNVVLLLTIHQKRSHYNPIPITKGQELLSRQQSSESLNFDLVRPHKRGATTLPLCYRAVQVQKYAAIVSAAETDSIAIVL